MNLYVNIMKSFQFKIKYVFVDLDIKLLKENVEYVIIITKLIILLHRVVILNAVSGSI